MKKCPYCAEEIQDDAVKCKYCGEWLNKLNQISDNISTVKQQQSSQSNEPKSKQQLELPIELKELRIDKNNFTYKGILHNYSEILSLAYKHSISSQNFINTSNTTALRIKLSNDTIDISGHTGFLFKDNKYLFPLIYKFIFSLTYNNIFKRYLDSLSQRGYIDYEYKSEIGMFGPIGSSKIARIYKNGNVQVGDKVANFQKAKEQGLLILGTEYQSIVGFSEMNRPHEIVVSEKRGLFFTGSLKINAEWDTQIIFSIVKGLSEGRLF